MPERILYISATGALHIIAPSPGYDAMEVAIKDVPQGLPFKIVPTLDIPTDRSNRDQWEVDPSILTDGVGAGPAERAPTLPTPAVLRPVTPGGLIRLRTPAV